MELYAAGLVFEQLGVLPMFFLELSTGLRKGELTALLWSDLDAGAKAR